MDYYTEVVNDECCAVWFKEGGRYYSVAVWFDDADHGDIAPVCEYLEEYRFFKQVQEDCDGRFDGNNSDWKADPDADVMEDLGT